MAKIPDDIKAGMKQLSEVTKIPTKDLLAQLKEFINTDENIIAMGDNEEAKEFKIRYAWALLYRQHSMTGNAVDYCIRVINSPNPRKIKVKGDDTYVGDLVALARPITKNDSGKEELGDVQYAAGTFWRDGAKNLGNLERNKVYRTKVIVKDNAWGINITSDRAMFTETDDKIPEFKKFYEKEIHPNLESLVITINSMDLHESENNTDIRILEATVIESEVGESSSTGREFGRYAVMDSSVVGGSYTIFVSPEEVEWAQGSIIRFGGTVSVNQDTGDIRWNNHFTVPTKFAMPKKITVKSVGKEEVDVDDLDDDMDDDIDEEAETTTKKETPKKQKEKAEKEENDEEDGDYEI